jgi:diketogulonate reductase-like aldo/keto reductase
MTADAVAKNGRARVLADGTVMPLLGLGVWQVPDGPECVDAVRWALEAGYRHIDTAQGYHNEASVGKALKESGVERGQVFVTTKFLPRAKDPVRAIEQSLRALGTGYVDLYLVHWPEDGRPGRGRVCSGRPISATPARSGSRTSTKPNWRACLLSGAGRRRSTR